MDLFENLDSLKDRAIDLAQAGVAKSKQIAEIAKLKAANMAEEDAIKKAYIEIGKLYYAEKGMAPDAAYTALCEKITAAKVNIEENKSRVEELKAVAHISDEEVPAATVVDGDVKPVETPAEPVVPTAPVEPLAEDKPEGDE